MPKPKGAVPMMQTDQWMEGAGELLARDEKKVRRN
jgi:hypothetical protein